MTARWRLAASLLAILLPALAMLHWAAEIASYDGAIQEPRLPEQVGEWKIAEVTTLDDETLSIIAPDAYRLWRYEAPGRTPVWMYVALYAARSAYARSAHDPEMCFPANGWEILGTQSVSIAVDGSQLVAKQLDAHRGTANESVLYWFQPAMRWPRSVWVEQLMRIADSALGRPQYAFVRLSGPARDGNAEADLVEFARLLAPSIRESVDQVGA